MKSKSCSKTSQIGIDIAGDGPVDTDRDRQIRHDSGDPLYLLLVRIDIIICLALISDISLVSVDLGAVLHICIDIRVGLIAHHAADSFSSRFCN